jgi:diguanylate cyclase
MDSAHLRRLVRACRRGQPPTAALDNLLKAGQVVDDETARALYKSHVGDETAPEAQRISSDVKRVLGDIHQATARTSESPRSYGEKLSDLGETLAAETAQEASIASALEDTQLMQEAMEKFRQAVAAGEAGIAALRRELDRTRVQALTDPLTNLLNRKGFDEAMSRLLEAPPIRGRIHCLVLLDIDHFKKVNDTHGHLTGDAVLVALGEVLLRATQGASACCARSGGEEFAMLFNDTTPTEVHTVIGSTCALIRMMKVRNRVTGEFIASVTVSGGIAAWKVGEDAASLISSADAALYRSKRSGRDRITTA